MREYGIGGRGHLRLWYGRDGNSWRSGALLRY
ncbi:hypothetical protein LINPERHAP1_LOCUS178 [Linum perenne]